MEAGLIPLNDALFAQSHLGYSIVFGERIVAIRAKQEIVVDALFLVFVHLVDRGQLFKFLLGDLVLQGRVLFTQHVV